MRLLRLRGLDTDAEENVIGAIVLLGHMVGFRSRGWEAVRTQDFVVNEKVVEGGFTGVAETEAEGGRLKVGADKCTDV